MGDFAKSWTIDELAQVQSVQPIKDISSLFGTWPGDYDDGFEESVQELRCLEHLSTQNLSDL